MQGTFPPAGNRQQELNYINVISICFGKKRSQIHKRSFVFTAGFAGIHFPLLRLIKQRTGDDVIGRQKGPVVIVFRNGTVRFCKRITEVNVCV